MKRRLFISIRYEKQILIVLLWSVLAFIGYNILTAQAAVVEKDVLREMKFTNDDLDDYGLKEMAIEQACKDNGGQWKDNNWCKFDKIGEQDEVEFEHQLEERGLSYYYADKEYLGDEWDKYQQEKYEKSQKGAEEKKYDEDEYVNGITPDENSDAEKYSDDTRADAHKYCAQLDYYDKNKKFCEKLAKGEDNTVFATEQGLKGEELETEIAAQEDALCDNEDADTTKIEICMSDEQKESKKIGKDECKEVNGDWKYGRCTFYEDYQSYYENNPGAVPATQSYVDPDEVEDSPTPVIEDWGNTVTDDEKAVKEVVKILEEGDENNVVNSSPVQTPNEPEVTEQEEEESDDSEVESEDNGEEEESSDDGGDSSDSGDDSSSSDDGGDSSESEE